MAQRIRPQLASWPKMAALVRLEVITDLANTLACSLVSAPTIFTSNSAVQPSPSPVSYTHLDVYKRQSYDTAGRQEAGMDESIDAKMSFKDAHLDLTEEQVKIETGRCLCLLYTSRCV